METDTDGEIQNDCSSHGGALCLHHASKFTNTPRGTGGGKQPHLRLPRCVYFQKTNGALPPPCPPPELSRPLCPPPPAPQRPRDSGSSRSLHPPHIYFFFSGGAPISCHLKVHTYRGGGGRRRRTPPNPWSRPLLTL
ncbi:unnamed protein product [Pleuronectes platessa]|uniref:Uncharacterized protein n=1 Tax=Pleuronectes platessa TaxID=8262 RepID=A0A9N7V7Q8_PLEPL|nr:unnamed protein product [Pleuronectes platessa]